MGYSLKNPPPHIQKRREDYPLIREDGLFSIKGTLSHAESFVSYWEETWDGTPPSLGSVENCSDEWFAIKMKESLDEGTVNGVADAAALFREMMNLPAKETARDVGKARDKCRIGAQSANNDIKKKAEGQRSAARHSMESQAFMDWYKKAPGRGKRTQVESWRWVEKKMKVQGVQVSERAFKEVWKELGLGQKPRVT